MPENNDNLDLFDENFADVFADTKTEDDKAAPAVAPVEATPAAPVASVAAPAAKVVTPVAKPVVPVKSASIDASKVESEIEEMMKPVSFGTKVSNVPIPRFKGKVDFKSRVAILSKDVVPVKIHFENGIGSFICFDGACCEEGLPRVKYLIPVMQYNTDKKGNPVDDTVEVKVLALGGDAYGALADAVGMSGRDITDVDVVIACSDEQYQKLTFAADASKPCSWKKFPCAREKYAYYKKYADKLYLAVGRILTEEAYKRKKGLVAPAAPAAPVGNSAPVPPLKDLME